MHAMDSKDACEVIDRICRHFGITSTLEGEYDGMSPYWNTGGDDHIAADVRTQHQESV